jgi:hypothetical protein
MAILAPTIASTTYPEERNYKGEQLKITLNLPHNISVRLLSCDHTKIKV